MPLLRPLSGREVVRTFLIDFCFRSSIARAAVSMALHITKEAERNSTPDFIRSLNITKRFAMLLGLVRSLRLNTER